MGKGILLLMTAALIGGSITLFQSNRTSIETTDRQVERQELMLAREAARSGHNYIRSLAREVEAEMAKAKGKGKGKGKISIPIDELVKEVNGSQGFLTAAYKGGTYKAWLEMASPSTYIANAEGRFGEATHFIGRHLLTSDLPVVPDLVVPGMGFSLKARFLQSDAGYCSAIYLEQAYRKGNQGGGNNLSGVDSKTEYNDNPDEKKINGSKKLIALEPELIYSSGHYRTGNDVDALYEKELGAGTLMNFILAVDQGCDLQGQDVPITDPGYDYIHTALVIGASTIEEMVEGKYVMLEKHPSKENSWRIAFEDLERFSDEQHADIKKNGYGDGQWKKRGDEYTYGGSGWKNRDKDGYYDLKNYGHLPDFSDQVFEIELVPTKKDKSVASGGQVAENDDKKDKDDKKGKK